MQGALGIFQADMNNVGAFFAEYASTGITAFASGGQTYATQILTQVARVDTVATTADSVRLPPSSKGIILYVTNAGANAMQVFGYGTETIDGIATGTGVSQAAGSSFMYVCHSTGAWVSMTVTVSAVTSGTIANVAINNSTIGLTSPAAGNFTNINTTGNVTVGNMVIAGNGTLNNVSIGLTAAAAGNFTNVNLSGNIVVSGTANITGNAVFQGISSGLNIPVTTVAATGTVQANAAAIATGFTLVTAADGTKGVILTGNGAGSGRELYNQAGANLLVYPPVGGTLNRQTANGSANLTANSSVVVRQYNTTAFFTVPNIA